MNELLHQYFQHILEEKGEFKEETAAALDSVLECFFKQFVADLQNKHKKDEKIKPYDIPIVLKNLNFSDAFIHNNEKAFYNYKKEEKSLKIKRLREAGFGATNEHAQLHQRILDSKHQSYVRNEEQEIYIGESEETSEFDSA